MGIYSAVMLSVTIDLNESSALQPASASTPLSAVVLLLHILLCQGQTISNAVHVLAHGLTQLPDIIRARSPFGAAKRAPFLAMSC